MTVSMEHRASHDVQGKLMSPGLVNQAITFKGLSKPRVTKGRSPNHSKVDGVINPGDDLKDLGHPKSH